LDSEEEIPEIQGTRRKRRRSTLESNPEPEPVEDETEKAYKLPTVERFLEECLVGVFMDPTTNIECVVALVLLPSGGDTADITIPENPEGGAHFIDISYDWPRPLYDMGHYFRKELGDNKMQIYHPLIQCLNAELRKYRLSVDSQPLSTIRVYLPVAVQSDSSTFSHRIDAFTMPSGVTTQVLYVTMKSFQTSYAVRESSKKAKAVFR
jgi:hypothetical protein